MSELASPRALPTLPKAGLDLINRSRPVVDRFAQPGTVVQKKLTQYLFFSLFLLTFLLLSYGGSVVGFMSAMGVTRSPMEESTQAKLKAFVRESAQIHLRSVYRIESATPTVRLSSSFLGTSLGLSDGLLQSFSEGEQNYLILREAGKHVRLHGLREILFGLALISIAASICVKLHLDTKAPKVRYSTTLALAVLLSLAMTQLYRVHEYEAEHFALGRMRGDPSITTAIKKIQPIHRAPAQSNIIAFLFSPQIPYETRLSLARIYAAPKKTIIRPTQSSPQPPAQIVP